MNYKFLDALEVSPVIAAVKDDEGVDACLKSESQVVFILYGEICTIPEIVSKVKAAGKLAVVHLDLIHGLASKNIAADFIKKYTEADGVISTKPTIIHRAKELGMLTILRVFLIDSMAYENVKTQVTAAKPEARLPHEDDEEDTSEHTDKLAGKSIVISGVFTHKTDAQCKEYPFERHFFGLLYTFYYILGR